MLPHLIDIYVSPSATPINDGDLKALANHIEVIRRQYMAQALVGYLMKGVESVRIELNDHSIFDENGVSEYVAILSYDCDPDYEYLEGDETPEDGLPSPQELSEAVELCLIYVAARKVGGIIDRENAEEFLQEVYGKHYPHYVVEKRAEALQGSAPPTSANVPHRPKL